MADAGVLHGPVRHGRRAGRGRRHRRRSASAHRGGRGRVLPRGVRPAVGIRAALRHRRQHPVRRHHEPRWSRTWSTAVTAPTEAERPVVGAGPGRRPRRQRDRRRRQRQRRRHRHRRPQRAPDLVLDFTRYGLVVAFVTIAICLALPLPALLRVRLMPATPAGHAGACCGSCPTREQRVHRRGAARGDRRRRAAADRGRRSRSPGRARRGPTSYDDLRRHRHRAGCAAPGPEPRRTWAADGLLAIFFFVAGLELKRELVVGQLRRPAEAVLPVVAAVCGMVVPALVYLAVARQRPATPRAAGRSRWPPTSRSRSPCSPSSAPSLPTSPAGVPADPRRRRRPRRDPGHRGRLHRRRRAAGRWPPRRRARGCYAWLQHRRVARRGCSSRWRSCVWVLVHDSGVHATVAGVALGLLTRVRPDPGEDALAGGAPRAPGRGRCPPGSRCRSSPCSAPGVPVERRRPGRGTRATPQPSVSSPAWSSASSSACFGGTWLTARLTRAELSPDLGWADVAAVALLAGIGFTVSLLIGDLAFARRRPGEHVKTAVLAGSVRRRALLASGRSCGVRQRHYRTRRREDGRDVTRPDGEAPGRLTPRPMIGSEPAMTEEDACPSSSPSRRSGALVADASRDLSKLVRERDRARQGRDQREVKNGADRRRHVRRGRLPRPPGGDPALDRGGLRPGGPRAAPRLGVPDRGGRLPAGRRDPRADRQEVDRQGRPAGAHDPHQQGDGRVPQEPAVGECRDRRPRPDASVARVAGPWEHRMVAANGARFHVAVAGDGPLVLLPARLPGVLVGLAPPAARRSRPPATGPRPWTCAATARATSRPAATTRRTLAADVAGVIRSLGARDAVVVGHGWGGLVAWTARRRRTRAGPPARRGVDGPSRGGCASPT